MEEAYDVCIVFRGQAEKLIAEWKEIRPRLRALEAYYAGPLWRRDFEDDGKGKFPPELKRGVLSEDGVYDLLQGFDEIREDLNEILGKGNEDGV